MWRILLRVGDAGLDQLAAVGEMAQLLWESVRRLFTRPFEARLAFYELERIGFGSMGVVGLVGLFIGMVLVVQIGFTLKRFGAEPYASEVVALAVVREMGPVLAGFLVAGRIGSGVAAEIGSMVISEQLDAMRALGADPIKKLVLPKIIAGFFGLPMLTAMADFLGIVGGMLMSGLMLRVSPFQFYNRLKDMVTIGDFMSGVVKTAAFGVIIVVVASYYGLRTTGGTVGVGRVATQSVVTSCILILMADLMITTMFFSIGGIMSV